MLVGQPGDSYSPQNCWHLQIEVRASEQEWAGSRSWVITFRHLPLPGVSNPGPEMAVNAAQHKIVNLLKTLSDFL